MQAFQWARRPSPSRTVRLPADRPFYVVSDIHLGDGTRSDSFVGKDRAFLDFLSRVEAERAHLVILGDIIDFLQAMTFTRVVRAHGRLLGRLSELAGDAGVTYVWGNHDYDISLYRDLLRWDVCSAVEVGPRVLLMHGHQFDSYIENHLQESIFSTLVHHQVERVTGSWIRVPLEDFYTRANRFTWWAGGRAWQFLRGLSRGLGRVGVDWEPAGLRSTLDFWLRAQIGDSMDIFRGAREKLLNGSYHTILCGHSHIAGVSELAPGRFYVNDGSWTFQAAEYAWWDGHRFHVRDHLSGREVGDESYKDLMDGILDTVDFDRWWREEYRGWFRFRCGELKRQGLPIPSWRVPALTESPRSPEGE